MALNRRFLMLQGPHGPFFSQLAGFLTRAGAEVWRVGVNGGDRMFWRGGRDRYLPYRGDLAGWDTWLADTLHRLSVTDLVLYGEPRPMHRRALEIARDRGIATHLFEEGYLRPYWISYEREGSNGNSPLMRMSVPRMIAALGDAPTDLPEAPARWGEMRQHVAYGALYHAGVLAGRPFYPRFVSHRDIGVTHEFRLYLKRLMMMPAHHFQRQLSVRRLRRGGFPYHLVLLQLEHDASFRTHSGFASMIEFLDLVMSGFAGGAPGHHHIVFKAHPLEDGRVPLARTIRSLSRETGMVGRVHFQTGGKLAPILDGARSVVTVNSTAAQQALWRGLPVRAFGDAVYAKPEFVSDQPLPEFFAAPRPPDLAAYRAYRQFLLSTSQIRGGFYSRRGRATLLRDIVDRMLSRRSSYDIAPGPTAADRQQIAPIPGT